MFAASIERTTFRLLMKASCTLGLVLSTAPVLGETPPVPSQPVAECDAVVDGKCYVSGPFSISAFSAGADHYQVCRSHDVTGWGGCDQGVTSNSGPTVLISGSHLPSDGFRRAFYFRACDIDNNCTGYAANDETYVEMDLTGPSAPGPSSVPCAYVEGGDCWVTEGFPLSTTNPTDSGSGAGSSRYYCRSHDVPSGFGGCDVPILEKVGCSSIPPSSACRFIIETHLPSDGFRRAFYVRAYDRVGNAGDWNVPVYVRADRHDPTVSATGSSSSWQDSAIAVIQAADETNGAGSNSGLEEVRYRWDNPLNAECSNGTVTSDGQTLTASEGGHTLYLCARDKTGRVGNWSGQYLVDSVPPTKPGNIEAGCGTPDASNDCWVTGDFFAATKAPPVDTGSGISGYRICRSIDVPSGWGGCDVDLVPVGTGGVNVIVAGSHVPADGHRRAYRWKAVDHAGNWGEWSNPGYARADRYPPQISATNSSTDWFTSRSLTINASDAGGPGASVNSGLSSVSYSWNTDDPQCNGFTPTTNGATLVVPEGDNTLYLCAYDVAGHRTTWNGTYRVDSASPVPVSVNVSSDTWSIGDGSVYQITARSTDAGSGIREQRLIINLHGSNSANRRGQFSWRAEGLGYLWQADQVPCTGGGHASKRHDAFHPETITLVGCSTSVSSSGQRTVVFSVRPEATFGEFDSAHDISLWSRDVLLNPHPYTNFDLNFSSTMLAPPEITVRQGANLPMDHGDTVDWGTVSLGPSGSTSARDFVVKNNAPAGSANLLLEHSPSNIQLEGSGRFYISGTLTSPLAPDQADSFLVRLRTDQPGTFSTTLKIWHSDPARQIPLEFNLVGTVDDGAGSDPIIDSISPTKLMHGGLRQVVINGQNFGSSEVLVAEAEYDPSDPDRESPPITSYSVNANGTQITATVDTRAAGVDGYYTLIVDTPCQGDCFASADFRVIPSTAPVVDLYTPSQLQAGSVYSMVISGANLEDATVTINDPDIALIDVDSSNDEIISGFLSIPNGTPPGNPPIIQIARPSGETLELPLEFQSSDKARSKKNIPILREEHLQKALEEGLSMPKLFIQEPWIAPRLRPNLADKEHSKGLNCFAFNKQREVLSHTRVRSVTLDGLGEVDPRVLEVLGLGEITRFGTITASAFAYLSFTFDFSVCRDEQQDRTFVSHATCISGDFGAEVVGFGGIYTTFDYCLPFQSPNHQTTVTSGGQLTRNILRSAGACTSVNQTTSPTGGGGGYANGGTGAHYADLELTSCCAETIYSDVSVSTFTEYPEFRLLNWEGTLPIGDPQPDPETCLPTDGSQLMLFLDVNSDNNFAAAASNYVPLGSLTDHHRYLPGSKVKPGEAVPTESIPLTGQGLNQVMTLVAAYVLRVDDDVLIVNPPQGVTEIQFEIVEGDTSRFPGVAMNWPELPEASPAELDFRFTSGTQTEASAAFNSDMIAPVQISCLDYGGYTRVTAESQGNPSAPDTAGIRLPAPSESNPQQQHPLPKIGWMANLGNSNGIGVIRVQSNGLGFANDNDYQPPVSGTGPLGGDGLTVYGEFRGFVARDKHIRTSPIKKDVFLRNEIGLGQRGLASDLQLTWHEINEDEAFIIVHQTQTPGGLPTTVEDRAIDFQAPAELRAGGSSSAQGTIRLKEEPNPQGVLQTLLGLTDANLSEPAYSPTAKIFPGHIAAAVSGARNNNFTVSSVTDLTIGHELGHAVNICHRQEDQNGDAEHCTDPNNPQTCSTVTACEDGGVLIPMSAIPDGIFVMHSGTALDRLKKDGANDTEVTSYHPNSKAQIRLHRNP